MNTSMCNKKVICLLLVVFVVANMLSGCSVAPTETVENSPLPVETTLPTPNPDIVEATAAPFDESVADTVAEPIDDTVAETEAPIENKPSVVEGLTPDQKKAVNTLNYLTSLLQDIQKSTKNRVYLQEAFDSLKDNLHPDIDSITQSYITDILNTLSNLRMLAVKREHLEYLYEQKKAQSIKAAIPNPLSVLNVVQSGSPIKALASLAFLAVDSIGSYLSEKAETDLQYLQDGWELDEKESKQIDTSQINAFNYMVDLVRGVGLHNDDALLAMNSKSVAEFIEIKNTKNIQSRIQALRDNENTYAGYGNYWLLLVQSYYDLGRYDDCLKAFVSYEKLNMDIFRKDHDYANIIPFVISAASETMTPEEYIPFTEKYLALLLNNCENSQWNLRYFAAITYLDLYAKSQNVTYLQEAFYIAKNNVNYLIKDQISENDAYLKPVAKIDINSLPQDDKDKFQKDKTDAEQINRSREETRKKELPPVYEPLWINCVLLFSLAQEYNVPAAEKLEIEEILHNNDHPLFLSEPLDDFCWFDGKDISETASASVEFNKGNISIPVKYLSPDYAIEVKLNECGKITVFDDWVVDHVERRTEGELDTFIAKLKSASAASHWYDDNGRATVAVYPMKDSAVPTFSQDFKAVPDNVLFAKVDLHFERVEK